MVGARLDDMQQSINEISDAASSQPVAAEGEAEPGTPLSGQGRLDPSLRFPDRELRSYTALQLGNYTQRVFGASWDWGPSSSVPALDIVPEVSLAFGEGKPAWMTAANMQYRLPWVIERESFWISPITSLGLGLSYQDGPDVVLNLLYGANVQLARARSNPVNLFVAHRGIDLFHRDRIILGLSLDR